LPASRVEEVDRLGESGDARAVKRSGARESTEADTTNGVDATNMEVAAGLPRELSPDRQGAFFPGGVAANEDSDLRGEQVADVGRNHAVLDGEKAPAADSLEPRKPELRETQGGKTPADNVRYDEELSAGAEQLDGTEEGALVEEASLAVGGPCAIVEGVCRESLGPE
jgi:hypothetical protein